MELGYKIKLGDKVSYDGEMINVEIKCYVLLNKLKDFIIIMDDLWGWKIVMSLVFKVCKECIYLVGWLDCDIIGFLFFINDGDMVKKLIYLCYEVCKIYNVEINKLVIMEYFEVLRNGIVLEDGLICCDVVEYVVDGVFVCEVGVEIYFGKNCIVWWMFEKFGYEVVKLDCVMFVGFIKKDFLCGFYCYFIE